MLPLVAYRGVLSAASRSIAAPMTATPSTLPPSPTDPVARAFLDDTAYAVKAKVRAQGRRRWARSPSEGVSSTRGRWREHDRGRVDGSREHTKVRVKTRNTYALLGQADSLSRWPPAY